jgi:hypothetical protein
MPAGYSGTPLIKKLGIEDNHRILLVNAPREYETWLEKNVSGQIAGTKDIPDIVHLFASDQKSFTKHMKELENIKKKNPKLVIWVSWYKKSAGIPTDLNEDLIRSYALKNGWVDVKVCAVSEEWSGLKLVVPLSLRK